MYIHDSALDVIVGSLSCLVDVLLWTVLVSPLLIRSTEFTETTNMKGWILSSVILSFQETDCILWNSQVFLCPVLQHGCHTFDGKIVHGLLLLKRC